MNFTTKLLAAVGALLSLSFCAGVLEEAAVGPGYVDNVVDQTCADAGTLLSPSASGISVDCECSAAVYWGHEDAIPLTGKSSATFAGNVRNVKCRSQANTTCDCHFLTAQSPSSWSAEGWTYLEENCGVDPETVDELQALFD